ncbi:hypothetical protein BOTBODRAFT_54379 [Botryobasidium botryosum FD-172 SS1]|uniref:Uncharacterized protein n=1 Tax=Botryobasidium botryosum (strain FD-172 SS1) TaxID=930990 RepID=A0A067MJG9_BOTB1|nr:hypothetical protein BOTBODRAFT_54379 [Botryobasidium botryosum FD-172 SS1]
MTRFHAIEDDLLLEEYPEVGRSEMIYVIVTIVPVLHWRIGWRAYDEQGEYAGWKIIEAIHASPEDAAFSHRFSFRSGIAVSTQRYHLFELGELDRESRLHLAGFGEYQEDPSSYMGDCRDYVERIAYELVQVGSLNVCTVETAISGARKLR